jgi:hypothetical protein
MLQFERYAQQRIFIEIDLAYRKVIGSAPVSVDFVQFIPAQGRTEN